MEMKYAVINGRHDAAVQAEPLDLGRPKPDEVLLETLSTFISAGTELAIYTGLDPNVDQAGSWCAYPYRPGYANVARIIAMGDEIKNAQTLQVGDRVFTMHRHCSHHFATPGREVIARIPDGVDNAVAAAARMATVSLSALQVADLQLNDWVAVIGLGLVGNLACQLFQLSGARVIGIDALEPRCQLAQRTGIEHVVGGSAEEIEANVKNLTGGVGVRISVDAVGSSAVIRQATHLTASHGEVILLGSPRASMEADVTEVMNPIHYRWVTLKGALEWRIPILPAPAVRHSVQGNLETVFDLLQRDKLRLEELISHRIPGDEIQQAYEGLLHQKDAYSGVALQWSKD